MIALTEYPVNMSGAMKGQPGAPGSVVGRAARGQADTQEHRT